MRLAELLWAEAFTEDGSPLGRVHDVRIALNEEGDVERTLVIEGVVVGSGAIAARLGYAHGDVVGPWPLTVLMRRLGRSARYIPWKHVVTFEHERLVVRNGAAEDVWHPTEIGGGE